MDLREALPPGAPRHPWELARFGFFSRLLKQRGVLDRPLRVLDVGSGDAWFARSLVPMLAAGSEVVCWDAGYTDASAARLGVIEPEVTLVTTPSPDLKADLVLMLDVLEHIEDDVAFLARVRGHLAPGGQVLISLPCWSWLFSDHDEALHHHRRYDPADARALVEGAGLHIEGRGTLFPSLLPVRMAVSVLDKVRGRSQDHASMGGRRTRAALRGLLEADARVSGGLARLGLSPPALSWWALCR